MSEQCRRYTVVVRGVDESARDDALAEAMNRMRAGNLSGADKNDTGGFYFDSTDDVPEGDRPA